MHMRVGAHGHTATCGHVRVMRRSRCPSRQAGRQPWQARTTFVDDVGDEGSCARVRSKGCTRRVSGMTTRQEVAQDGCCATLRCEAALTAAAGSRAMAATLHAFLRRTRGPVTSFRPSAVASARPRLPRRPLMGRGWAPGGGTSRTLRSRRRAPRYRQLRLHDTSLFPRPVLGCMNSGSAAHFFEFLR